MRSSLPEHNRHQVEDFVSRLEILRYGDKAAAHYGEIRATLERQGIPIGVNDLNIAAHARSEDFVMATNNLKEIERVAGLRFENWFKV